jgi:hypothetical protein
MEMIVCDRQGMTAKQNFTKWEVILFFTKCMERQSYAICKEYFYLYMHDL